MAIETSCDETAAAVVENGTKVLSSAVASSVELQAKYGGVVPEKAAREQVKSVIPVIEEALLRVRPPRGSDPRQFIDALAVTIGPGLVGSLLVGIETAKTLAFLWQKPIVPVNHLVGHIYSVWISPPSNQPGFPNIPSFPALVLIVSGGHTELVLMKNHGRLKEIGSTRDDAAGECFDKTARILGLGYPGGPAVAKAADQISPISQINPIRLPRPMLNDPSFDFSFSGLKTAVLKIWQGSDPREGPTLTKNQAAHEIQEAITDILVKKTLTAAQKYKVKSILVVGGVSANKRLREKMFLNLANLSPWPNFSKLYFPDLAYTTDNAAMVGAAAFFNYRPKNWAGVGARPSFSLE